MKKISIICATLLIAACSSTPKVDTPQTTSTSNSGTTAAANTATANNTNLDSGKLANDMQQIKQQEQQLSNESVYFDFDRAAIKPEFQNVMQQQATFALAHKADIVTVSGNADERGSEEYNLALGQRRAQSVKKSLELLGVNASQIKAISYGEEKPRATCHEEKCWQENRRVDFNHKIN